jgi:hypothetical protein
MVDYQLIFELLSQNFGRPQKFEKSQKTKKLYIEKKTFNYLSIWFFKSKSTV